MVLLLPYLSCLNQRLGSAASALFPSLQGHRRLMTVTFTAHKPCLGPLRQLAPRRAARKHHTQTPTTTHTTSTKPFQRTARTNYNLLSVFSWCVLFAYMCLSRLFITIVGTVARNQAIIYLHFLFIILLYMINDCHWVGSVTPRKGIDGRQQKKTTQQGNG